MATLSSCCKWLCALAISIVLSIPAEAADFKADSFSELGAIRRRIMASHFLMRTTFGPRSEDIDALALRIQQIGKRAAFEEWIDDQFTMYPLDQNWETYQPDRGRIWPLAKTMVLDMGYQAANFGNQENAGGVDDRNEWKERAWWHRVITAEDQLRQRMAWAMAQIFVTAEGPAIFQNRSLDTSGNPRWLCLAKYYDDVCIANAFGNYRDLLDSMTFHPVMGIWLSSVQNRKANPTLGTEPDENYAREIMQLFSIGLVELRTNGVNRIGPGGEFVETYDNETIRALARVFTGMVYDNNNPGNDSINAGINLHLPMEMYEQEHDTGQKVAFGGDLVIPARGQSEANALQDISDVHDYLAFDHPNTGPFLCRRLIQRFVMSNPPGGYLRRVVRVFNANQSNPQQFQEVIKAILLDRVALAALKFKKTSSPPGLQVIVRHPTERTRLREPVLRFAALFRAFSPYPDPRFVTNGSKFAYTTPGGPEGTAGNQYFLFDNDSSGISAKFAQAPFEAPSVFNFYLPDYQATGEIADYVPSKAIPNGKLYSPEFQILTPVSANEVMNEFRGVTTDDDFDIGNITTASGSSTNVDVNLDYTRYYGNDGMLGPSGTEPTTAQIEDFIEDLDLLLCAGAMSNATKQVLLNVCQGELNTFNLDSISEKQDLVQAIISAVLQSPDCAVIP